MATLTLVIVFGLVVLYGCVTVNTGSGAINESYEPKRDIELGVDNRKELSGVKTVANNPSAD